MTKVRIRPEVESNSGRRRGWIKMVTAVDADAKNGYGVHGDFLTEDREVEVEVGAILLRVDPEGSVKNSWQSAHVFRVIDDGEFEELTPDYDNLNWKNDFLSVRDILLKALMPPPVESNDNDSNPLAGFSDDELWAEFVRRGITL